MKAPLLALPLVLGAGSSLQAQTPLTHVIDSDASTWTWSGTTDLGPLVPVDSNMFQLTGTTELELTGGVQAIDTGRFTGGGSAMVVPDLAGFIPNPIPGFPPLATIDVTGLELAWSSPSFPVDATGNFTTMITVTALAGTVDVVPLSGSPSSTDLAGTVSDPQPAGGNLSYAGGTVTLDAPQSTTFSFTDPDSGLSGTITLDGTIVADWDCPTATVYCTAKTNSQGCLPQIGFDGTNPSLTDASAFDVTATGVLGLKNGLLFYGIVGPANVPFQGGTLCTLPPLRRTTVQFSNGSSPTACDGFHSFDLNAWFQGGNDPNVQIGTPLGAQYWTRDPAQADGTGSGLTDAVAATVCP